MRSKRRAVNKSYDQEFENKVIELFKSGMVAADIARQLERNVWIIYCILNKNGLKAEDNNPTKQPSQRGKPIELQMQIVEFYQKPSYVLETARHFGMPYGTVRKILAKHGVLREDGRHLIFSETDETEMVRLWNEEKWPMTKIGEKFGTQRYIVERTLRKRGVFTTRRPMVGEAHYSWKGGKHIDRKGYVFIKVDPKRPFSVTMAIGKGEYVLEHRLVMAEKLGRPLKKSETVHHIDGDRGNNSPENLQLRQGNHGSGVKMRCKDCGSFNIEKVELD
jgi:hypothetical protein